MALQRGDHLRLVRDDKLISPSSDDYQEFEVVAAVHRGEVVDAMTSVGALDEKGKAYAYYDIRLKVVEMKEEGGKD